MTEAILVLAVLVGFPLLFGARGQIARLEHRLHLVEEELRRRIAMGAERLPEPVIEPAVKQAPEPEPEPVPEPEIAVPAEEPKPEPAIALAVVEETLKVELHVDPIAAHEEAPAHDEPAPEHPRAKRMSINFEELFGRKLPIWAGGITLAIAGIFIVKYAIDAGFFGRVFTPPVQAACGALFGLGLIGGAEWAWRKRDKVDDPRVSQALSGAGISTLYAVFLVAAEVYQMISPLAAFFGLAAVTAAALWLSLRHGMPSALLGLAGGLAAPALTVAMDAHVPLLAVYLTFTIGGLVGVSRIQRWPWLAAIAIVGGAGWSLWLILIGQAVSMLGALSVGTFLLLLAIAMPLFAFKGAAARLLRSIAAVVGAAQLALLVAIGGYQPLHWGLFALIAAAGQWLAWREREFAIVPTLGAALSVLLLLLWPDPTGGWLALVGLSLVAIHAGPLLARLWSTRARLQSAIELSAIAVAIPVVVLRHFHAPWGGIDVLGAEAALGGAVLALASAALGWKTAEREEDHRFALLLATGSALLCAAAWLAFPHWQAPLWFGAVSAALLFLSPPAKDWRIEYLAAAFSGAAIVALLVTLPGRLGETAVLVDFQYDALDHTSLARWGGLAVLFALFAWRARTDAARLGAYMLTIGFAYGALAQLVPGWALPALLAGLCAVALEVLRRREEPAGEIVLVFPAIGTIVLLALTGPDAFGEWQHLGGPWGPVPDGLAFLRWAAVAGFWALFAARSRMAVFAPPAQAIAALAAYGALAQLVPPLALPLMPALAVLGLAWWSKHLPWPRLAPAAGALAFVSVAWAALPMALWGAEAGRSLAGIPMELASLDLAPLQLVRRLLLPALLVGAGAWLLRERIGKRGLAAIAGVLGVVLVVALHGLYRAGFAAIFGTDFTATGLGQRLLWDGLLIAAAWLLWKRAKGMLSELAAPAVLAVAALHVTWYSLALHDPLWAEQAVGSIPVANLALPLFAALPLCLALLMRMVPEHAAKIDLALQPVLMASIGLFGWATLRQAFHGTLLVEPGLGQFEDIMRSILGIALAIGYLLWGIRSHRRIWRIASLLLVLAAVAKVFIFDASGLEGLLRIASFVALGFSLIGIGWLYSRQLRSEAA